MTDHEVAVIGFTDGSHVKVKVKSVDDLRRALCDGTDGRPVGSRIYLHDSGITIVTNNLNYIVPERLLA